LYKFFKCPIYTKRSSSSNSMSRVANVRNCINSRCPVLL
jgi:hypothetical protein